MIEKKAYSMEKEDEAGYFAVLVSGRKIPSYSFRVTKNGETKEFEDLMPFLGR